MGAGGDAVEPIRSAAESLDAALAAVPDILLAMPWWEAALAIALGLVSLFYGLKLFHGVVIVYAALLGALVGLVVADAAGLAGYAEIGCVLVGAGALGLLAWPLLKYAVSLFGGLAGGLVGGTIGHAAGLDPLVVLAGGAIGFLAGAVLALLVFRGMLIFITSLVGAYLLVGGVLALAMLVPAARDPLATSLARYPMALPLAAAVPAIVGAASQTRGRQRRDEPRAR